MPEQEKNKNWFIKHKILTAIIVIFVVAIFSNMDSSSSTVRIQNSSSTNSTNSLPIKEQKDLGKIEVKSHTKKVNYGYPEIVGEVVNNMTKSVTFVKVTATFYDAAGTVVGTSFTYAGDTSSVPLEPEKTSPFEISGDKGLTFDSYKLDVSWN